MAGNREGALKAAQTARERHGKDFHAKVASKSWDDPNRSRVVGFATMDPDTHKNISAKGGKNKHGQEKTFRKVGDVFTGPDGQEYKVALVEVWKDKKTQKDIRQLLTETEEATSGTGE